MFERNERGRNPPNVDAKKLPTAEDFNPERIRRWVVGQTIQDLTTMVPLCIGAAGALWIGLMGIDLLPFVATLGGVLGGGFSWVLNLTYRGPKLASRRTEDLLAQRQRYREGQAEQMEMEFRRFSFQDGVQQARELREAYQRLRDDLLRRPDEGRSATEAQQFLIRAEDAYLEGVEVLRQVLGNLRVTREIDVDKLRRELTEWLDEHRRLQAQKSGNHVAALSALERRITSHQERLKNYQERLDRIQELMAESETVEAALENVRMQVLELGSRDLTTLIRGNAAQDLINIVGAARRVEQRLQAMQHPVANPDDDMYAELGRQRQTQTETQPILDGQKE